jgi:hypothetical protein
MPEFPGPVLLVDDAAVRNALKFALEMEGLAVRALAVSAHSPTRTGKPSRDGAGFPFLPPAVQSFHHATPRMRS